VNHLEIKAFLYSKTGIHGRLSNLITIVTSSLVGALIVTPSIIQQYTKVYITGAMCEHSFGHHMTCPHKCKGNPNSLGEQLLTQDLARGNPKLIYK
jgi:hypothetical protein